MGRYVICLYIAVCCQFGHSLKSQSYISELKNNKIKVPDAIGAKAFSFALKDVTLLPGSPFKHAMDKDAAYLLSLEPDRLLHRFHKNAGLPTKGTVYGGWESEGLSGHTLGHYLSACAMMYSSTMDKRFKAKADYIIDELIRCQEARKTGYIGAIPNEDEIFGKVAKGEIKSSGFDLNGGWSPWYTVHKVMAGLFDVYMHCNNKKALKALKGMADWTENTLKNLSSEQLQNMLRCEWGGMNDVLANLYAVTGNKKYLNTSYRFFDDFVMKPLSERVDPLPGKHSNTNVPKAIGSARQYELTGNDRDKTIASFFWETMTHHHSYVIGGNSNYEYCGDQNKLNDRLSDNTCETCNTYNMLKLTRHLFSWQPTSELGDYYERALYNHILASQHPESGMMTYFVPLRMGAKKVFSDALNTFTCCVGSGMENHAKYGEGIYSEGEDGSLFVNLFIPSVLKWKRKKAVITQETSYPESGNTLIKLELKKENRFPVKIRKPWWSKNEILYYLNGKSIQPSRAENGFAVFDRIWKNGDEVLIKMPMELYHESMPDNIDRIALLYGPVVLAGQLGDTMPDIMGIPVLLTDNRNVKDWLVPDEEKSLSFKTKSICKPFVVHLLPFYKTYEQHYNVYWDFFSEEQWESQKEVYEKQKKEQQDIEDRTMDNFRVGEMQPERDHHLIASDRSYVSDAMGVNGREARAGHFFSFEMKLLPSEKHSTTLLLTFIGDDKDRKFDILVDGQILITEELQGGVIGKFYNKLYPLPKEWINGKDKITVKIDAKYTKTAGRIFGARTMFEY